MHINPHGKGNTDNGGKQRQVSIVREGKKI